MNDVVSTMSNKKARVSSLRTVDLRSDTVTKPTASMRKAMSEAEVGDDVFCDDPTVIKLESMIAEKLKKESALFFPSGTMCNLVSVMAHCSKRGSEVILGNKCHIYIYEQAGIAQIAGVGSCVIPNEDDGTMDIKAIENAIRIPNIHFPTTELIALETTHNYCGGKVLSREYLASIRELSLKKNIPIHLDGARIWNAACKSGISVSDIASYADSVSVCLSKGLGAPVGSLLVGTKSFIERARRCRKAVGGGMRQVGVLAAAGIEAIKDFDSGMINEDHRRAQLLAQGLSKIPGLVIDPNTIETNILFIEIDSNCINSDHNVVDSHKLASILLEYKISVLPKSNTVLRLVVHRDLNDEDIQYTAVSRDMMTYNTVKALNVLSDTHFDKALK